MWRAYLLRERLGEKFDELVNIVVLWSALRCGANHEARYEASRAVLAKYKETLFRRYAAGKLKAPLIPLHRAERLGRRLVERISRRSESRGERRARKAQQQQWVRERRDDRKLYRAHPDIDLEVIQKGFGFLLPMLRAPVPAEEQKAQHYVRELFDLEMRTFPRPETAEDNYEIEGTPYQFDVWLMQRIAELVARTPSPEIARTFYVPILELGPAGRHWVEDFLEAWITIGLQIAADTAVFVRIWQDMVQYTVSLAAWTHGKSNVSFR